MTFIFFAVLMLSFLFFKKPYYTSKYLKHWRRGLDLDKHHLVFQALYTQVDGFALSRQARLQNDALEYIYGEVDFESFIALLTRFKPNFNTVFYDLGSGCGKAVIACAMVFNVKKSCGIELFENLQNCAKLQLKALKQLPEYSSKAKTIILEHGNFLDFSLEDATLVFINSSAFFGAYWCKISQHLERLMPGTIVFSSSRKIHSPLFKILYDTSIKMSWGIVTLYVQERFANDIT